MRGKSAATIAMELLDSLDNARPYDLTFVPGIPEGDKQKVQGYLKGAFELWEKSWIRPGLEEIVAKGKKKQHGSNTD